jgi:hypothetical protein
MLLLAVSFHAYYHSIKHFACALRVHCTHRWFVVGAAALLTGLLFVGGYNAIIGSSSNSSNNSVSNSGGIDRTDSNRSTELSLAARNGTGVAGLKRNDSTITAAAGASAIGSDYGNGTENAAPHSAALHNETATTTATAGASIAGNASTTDTAVGPESKVCYCMSQPIILIQFR